MVSFGKVKSRSRNAEGAGVFRTRPTNSLRSRPGVSIYCGLLCELSVMEEEENDQLRE